MVKTYMRKKIFYSFFVILLVFGLMIIRLSYLMLLKSEYYFEKAQSLHEREREIKAKRGIIYDRNGVVLAGNKAVCSISVVHSQLKDAQEVQRVLCELLDLDAEYVKKKLEANTIREKIKSNVDKEVADQVRKMKLPGVMVDEDYKRYYPYDDLASKVLGFTGADNQGIVGLEIKYNSILSGVPGSILTMTDAHGRELINKAENRKEPIAGNNLHTTLDVNIQKYVQQCAWKVLKAKQAKQVSVIIMDPNNGEMLAMVNVPEHDVNHPYTLVKASDFYVSVDEENDVNSILEEGNLQNALNQMWRNFCIHDTYEPGSTFKTITAAAALEEQVVKLEDTFYCPGYRIVEDWKIRCHKVIGHGNENFKEGIMNSCNPVFMEVGARVGASKMYQYYKKLGLFEKTGIDLPGEANSIMHKLDRIGAVELATMSFGQSFQITPVQLIRAVSATINGGDLVTPHFAKYVSDEKEQHIKEFWYQTKKQVIQKDTSDVMRELLEAVVEQGSGNKGQVEGFRIGGKTATSEKLPRGNGKYIASFLGFAPANQPKVIGLILIDEPKGAYYGGTIAAPIMAEIFDSVLPYLSVEKDYTNSQEKVQVMQYEEDTVQ